MPRGVEAAVSQPGDQLRASHEVVQNAIDRYALDHHAWPAGDARSDKRALCEALLEQLTHYTNAAGQANSTPNAEFCYGPYLDADGAGAELLTEFAQTVSTRQLDWDYNPANGHFSIKP